MNFPVPQPIPFDAWLIYNLIYVLLIIGFLTDLALTINLIKIKRSVRKHGWRD